MSTNESEIYLTNGSAENVLEDTAMAAGIAVDLEELGLAAQEDYPLTEAEAAMVFDDEVTFVVGGTSYYMLMGYSTLKGSTKYAAPNVEHSFDPDVDGEYETALQECQALVDHVAPGIEAVGGSVRIEEEGSVNRHVVEIRVPMEYAVTNAASYEEWVEHLTKKILKADAPKPAPAAASPSP